MVWRGLLLIAALSVAPNVANVVAASPDECSASSVFVGCPHINARANDDIVELIGSKGSDAPDNGSTGPEGKYDEEQDGAIGTDLEPEPLEWTEVCQAGHPECVDPPAPDAEPTDPASPAPARAVTLRDVAAFRPAVPGDVMEPGGWAVVGLPANFVAAASAQVVAGTLLGRPADVRFTPVGYRWAHSDGSSVTSDGPGATWEELGQDEFTATSTSHVYAAPGEYTVTLEVALAAEYRFGGSAWQPVAGTLAVATEPRRIVVGEVDTVLTRGDCTAAPDDPGC